LRGNELILLRQVRAGTVEDEFVAVGSGRDYAIAAMALGHTARVGVEIASRFDPGTDNGAKGLTCPVLGRSMGYFEINQPSTFLGECSPPPPGREPSVAHPGELCLAEKA